MSLFCCNASCSLEKGPAIACRISSMAVDCMISFTRAGCIHTR